MARDPGKAAVFSLRLKAEMEKRGLSVRQLGRLIDPDDMERGRRKVHRHLRGKHMPSVASRVAYAAAFGVDRNTFLEPSEADDEEDVLSALNRKIRAVRRELAKLEREVAA